MGFVQARKSQAKARVAIEGTAGSGKTMTALKIAYGLTKAKRERGEEPVICVIDTERGSSALYSDRFDFLILEMPFPGAPKRGHHPLNYIRAIEMAEEAGADVIVIDSLSHEWNGEGGVLDSVDAITAASKSKSSYNEGWKVMSPLHERLVQKIVAAKAHIIATMRTKTDYEQANGKIRKIGLKAEQRDGMDYEFTVVLRMDDQHNALVTKTRWDKIADEVIRLPDESLGAEMYEWLMDGVPAQEKPQPAATADEPSADGSESTGTYVDLLNALLKRGYRNKKEVDDAFAALGEEFNPQRYAFYLSELAK